MCITGDQHAALVAQAGERSGGSDPAGAASNYATDTPIIQVNGDNPAIVQVGDTYNDLGATITGPQADLNLGIKTYLNGTLTSNIVLDATDTIDYVVTDQNGLTATSTRTVIIELPISPSIVPTADASTTQATSTSQ